MPGPLGLLCVGVCTCVRGAKFNLPLSPSTVELTRTTTANLGEIPSPFPLLTLTRRLLWELLIPWVIPSQRVQHWYYCLSAPKLSPRSFRGVTLSSVLV